MVGIDETLERRWGSKIKARGIYRDAVRTERYYADKPRTHKKLTDWARQLLLLVKRWVADRQVVAVGDSTGPPGGYAVIDLLSLLQGQVSLISRLRLDAALYAPVPIPLPGQRGRKWLKGTRLPTLLKVAEDKTTSWQNVEVADWYGGQAQRVDYCTGTALCGAARAVSHRQKACGHPVGTGASKQ